MLHPLNFPLTQPDDPPSKRVAAARREINYRLFYLDHVHRGVLTSNKQGQSPTPPCGGAGVCPENTSQDLGDNRDE